MFLGLFGDKDLDRFARGLAKELGTRFPPATLKAERLPETKYNAMLSKALQHVFLLTQNYCRDHKVGLLKKARLSKIFQDELVSLGYEAQFIEHVTFSLADRLSKL